MSNNKGKTTEMRKSPISLQNSSKSAKSKTPKSKVSKTATAGKPLSNGVHEVVTNGVTIKKRESEVTNGVTIKKRESEGEQEIAKMNLMTLQKVDGSVSRILATIPHVVLYEFKTAQNVWERTSSEGTLFVYNRKQSGLRHGFMILNRLSSENTQEAIAPGMEFRLQSPFILYGKESGAIFGLCIQDKDQFTKTGNLLISLSAEASSASGESSDASGSSSPSTPPTTHPKGSVSPVPGGRHPKGSSVSPVSGLTAVGGGGQQSPQPPQKQRPKTKKPSNGAELMDLLETAGRNYLGGQSFSDDADSHDEASSVHSPPERAATAPQQRVGVAFEIGGGGVQYSSNARGIKNGHSNTALPKQVPPVTHHQGGVPLTTPPTQPHPHQQRQPMGSPVILRSGNYQYPPPLPSSTSPQGKRRGVVQHAASFDQTTRYGQMGAGAPGTEVGHGSRSNSLFGPGTSPMGFFGTRTGQHYPTATAPQFYSAQVPSRAYSATTASSFSSDNSIVKKLFESKSEPANISSASTANSSSISVQALFSQAASTSTAPTSQIHLSSSTGNLQGLPVLHQRQKNQPHPPSLFSALSLDEVEKEMTEEAPSVAVDTDTQVARSLSPVKSVGKASSSSLPSSSGHAVLLQPSAFATSSSGSSSMAESAPAPAPTVISVEPPSPLTVVPVSQDTNSRPQVFPPIPPIMHSAGMTAPPLSGSPVPSSANPPAAERKKERSSSPKKPRRTPPPKGGGAVDGGRKPVEPSGADTTAATTAASTRELHTPPTSSASLLMSSTSTGELPVPGRSATVPISALMSPQQFSSSSSSSSSAQPPPRDEGKPRGKGVADIGLTKEQMQVALLYLIQNDHGFIDKLHDAYKMSLSKRLS